MRQNARPVFNPFFKRNRMSRTRGTQTGKRLCLKVKTHMPRKSRVRRLAVEKYMRDAAVPHEKGPKIVDDGVF